MCNQCEYCFNLENQRFPYYLNHDSLHRTQSEEPPYDGHEHRSIFGDSDGFSHMHSQQSDLDTTKSDILMNEHLQHHSRNLSQASGMSNRSIDSHDIGTLQSNNNFIETGPVNTSGCIDFMETATQLHYNSNSLPRRKCFFHANEYQTNSLPRKYVHQYDLDGNETSAEAERIKANLAQFRAHGTFSLESNAEPGHSIDMTKRRYSIAVPQRHLTENDFDDLQSMVRRNSTNTCLFYHDDDDENDDEEEEEDEEGEEGEEEDDQTDDSEESDSYCQSCQSEDDVSHEKEIFIDFKPYGRARLQKTMSEGEILFERRREINHNDVHMVSTSEEELKVPSNDKERYLYSGVPIKDENVYDKDNYLKLPDDRSVSGKNRREAFRKRSISLEPSPPDVNDSADNKSGESKPASPVDKYKNISTFPSSDSLANDLTRDHSDGNWNESQVTVVPMDPK